MTPIKCIVAAAALAALGSPSPLHAQAAPKPSGGAPAIDISQMKIDLGRVYERDTFEYHFVVRNKGNANLVIGVQPGCGCTTAAFDTVIAPGAEGRIDLLVDGHKVEGEFSKQAIVKCNDPRYPELSLIVAGTKIPYIEVTPSGPLFLQGRYGEKVETTLTLASHEEGLDFKVTGVTSDIDDQITYDVKRGPQKGSYTLRVNKRPELPTDSKYGSVVVHTNSTHTPEVTLPVQVMSKGSIDVSPTVLDFGPVAFASETKPGPPVSRYVLVTKASGRFRVEKVTVNNPRFVAAVDPITEGQEYRISVTFTPPVQKTKRQSEQAELIIHTNDEREPAIRVPVLARTL